MAQGVNPADTDLEAISQHRRAITPLRLSESRFEHGFRRGMLTLIRPHGLIAFENGEKCEPGAALRVTVCRATEASLTRLNANVIITTILLPLVNCATTSNRLPRMHMKFEKGECIDGR